MTMTDSGSAGPQPGPGAMPHTPTPRWLRRSRTDRVISGVAGGLGEYFALDAVIFRVLFAVLSFFGGVGLLMYALAWLLVPEPDIGTSALDKAIGQLRTRRVPPWLVVLGGAAVLWLGWFAWWAPEPTFPAILLLAVLALVLIHRLGHSAEPTVTDPATAERVPTERVPTERVPTERVATDPGAATAVTPLEWSAPGVPEAVYSIAGYRGGATAAGQPPLIPPLNDTRRSMQAWLSEAGAAHRERLRRRRPIKVAAGLCLAIAWAVVAMLDAFRRVEFPVYLWVGLAVLGAVLVVSLATRRMTLSLLVPIGVLTLVALALGGTRASLTDGSGRIGWKPTTVNQLADHRQFAGQSTLDLTELSTVTAARTVHISQAAGEVRLLLPAGLNATVVSDLHMGDVQNGTSRDTGQYVSGLNVHLELPPAARATGAPLTIYVTLAAGHVQVDRAAS